MEINTKLSFGHQKLSFCLNYPPLSRLGGILAGETQTINIDIAL